MVSTTVVRSTGSPSWVASSPDTLKSYAYIEFATESRAQATKELDKSVFQGWVIKCCPKGPIYQARLHGPQGPSGIPRCWGAFPTTASRAGPVSGRETGTGVVKSLTMVFTKGSEDSILRVGLWRGQELTQLYFWDHLFHAE